MWDNGESLVVAVSGGQDSLALLHSLHLLRARWGLTLHVAHFNHSLRGAEADEDARLVAELAEQWSIPCTIGKGDVAGAAKRTHCSVHEAAREQRHRFLETVSREIGAGKIALGHTLDDRIETVLMNLLRGAGVDGLAGIPPVSCQRVRPLIEVSREETEAYCRRHELSFRTDPSNQSLRYTRSRIRQELLPLLAAYYNSGVRSSLARLAILAADDSAFLDAEARARFDRATANIDHGRVVLRVAALREEQVAMQRRIVRLAVESACGTLQHLDFETTEALLLGILGASKQKRFKFTLAPGHTTVESDGEWAVWLRVEPPSSSLPIGRRLEIPGVTEVASWGVCIEAEVVSTGDPTGMDSCTALIDRDAVRGELFVRNRQPGDRLQPLGMTGTRKVQDILTDRKVPRAERDRVPIVADQEGIVWVAGHTLADRVRVTPRTREALKLKLTSHPASFRPAES